MDDHPPGPASPEMPDRVSPTPRGTWPTAEQVIPASAALAGAALVIAGSELPWARYDGTDVSILDCGLVGCAWFAADALGGAAVAVGLAAAFLAGRWRGAAPAALLLLTGLWMTLMFVGFALGSGPSGTAESAGPVGLAGGGVLLLGGVIALVRGRRPTEHGRPTTPTQGTAAAPASTWPAVALLLAGIVLIALGAVLPWSVGPGVVEAPDISVLDCGTPGCGWFATETLGLMVTTIAAGVMLLTGWPGRAVIGPVMGGLGLWAILLFVGYLGFGLAELSPEASIGLGAPFGIAGGVLTGAGGIWTLLAERLRGPR